MAPPQVPAVFTEPRRQSGVVWLTYWSVASVFSTLPLTHDYRLNRSWRIGVTAPRRHRAKTGKKLKEEHEANICTQFYTLFTVERCVFVSLDDPNRRVGGALPFRKFVALFSNDFFSLFFSQENSQWSPITSRFVDFRIFFLHVCLSAIFGADFWPQYY